MRSTKEVLDYHIRATDGDIGHVEDIIVGDASWVVRYFVVDTRNWLPEGKRYWCRRNGWITMPMNCEYEERFYDFYGRPKYWKSRKFGQL